VTGINIEKKGGPGLRWRGSVGPFTAGGGKHGSEAERLVGKTAPFMSSVSFPKGASFSGRKKGGGIFKGGKVSREMKRGRRGCIA